MPEDTWRCRKQKFTWRCLNTDCWSQKPKQNANNNLYPVFYCHKMASVSHIICGERKGFFIPYVATTVQIYTLKLGECILNRFSAICFKKHTNFVASCLLSCTPFCFPSRLSEKETTLKGQNLAPLGSQIFPFRVEIFQKGSKNNYNRVFTAESVSFPLITLA